MKKNRTTKWFKITLILHFILIFFSISSLASLIIGNYSQIDMFWSLGNVLVWGWLFNPTALIAAVIGLFLSFFDKGYLESRKLVDRKSICYLLLLIFDVLLYFVFGFLLVLITGGV